MVSRLERIILAAIISLTSFCFSYYWYKNGNPGRSNDNKSEPIAILQDSSSAIQRKPQKRVIWQTISPGELLYSKEAIRTPSDSGAEIIFLGENTKIELDPDSVVVLEKATGDLALNFLKGNVFVSGGSKGLKIKSGDNVVDAANGEINLSKKKGEDLELQVLTGQATVNANGKSVQIGENQAGVLSDKGVEVNKNLISVQEPVSNARVYLDPKKRERFKVVWKGIDPKYNMELLAGRRVDRMRVSKTAKIQKTKNSLRVKFKAGFIYWKLRATAEGMETLVSPLFKNKVVMIRPPVFVDPQNQQVISLHKETPTYEFRWVDSMGMKDANLQIWREEKGQVVPGSEQTIEALGKRAAHEFKQTGIYAARVTGFLKESEEKEIAVSSEVIRFKVNLKQDLDPPEPIAPLAAQKIRYIKAREEGLRLIWESLKHSQGYKVKILHPGKSDYVTKNVDPSESKYVFKDFVSGVYRWSVATVQKNGKTSKYSDERSFVVTDVPPLAWGEEAEQGWAYYVGEQPRLNLNWDRGPDKAVNWRIRFAQQGDWTNARSFKLKQPASINKVDKGGFYEVQAQALDGKGGVVAQTSRKIVNVKTRPLLPAPEFDPSLGAKLEADSEGNIELFWETVSGAKEYTLHMFRKVRSGEKKTVKRIKTTEISLKRMTPGSYRLELRSVDRHGRESSDSDNRVLKVRNESRIRAPAAVKKVKVKGVYKKE